jgi:hypothetical protein
MVGMHTVDAPPPTRQPKCQANLWGTPTNLPSKWEGDAKQNANQIAMAEAVGRLWPTTEAEVYGFMELEEMQFSHGLTRMKLGQRRIGLITSPFCSYPCFIRAGAWLIGF